MSHALQPKEKILGSTLVAEDHSPDYWGTLRQQKFRLAAGTMQLGALLHDVVKYRENEHEDVIVLGISAREKTALNDEDDRPLDPELSPLQCE